MRQEPVGVIQPSQDERTMATLAQALQLVGSWIAPLVILIVRRQSPFVSFHALQALLLQVVYTFLMIVAILGFFVFGIAGTMAMPEQGPPPMFILMMIPLWAVMMALWVISLVMAIVYAIKAGRGEWAEYPVLGGIARKILKLGPGGVSSA